ncbi:site-specific DNA-methyltransferase [Bradyrhizobium sediminis]|uniref:Methyltransferase n=2 Tax=Bradyrhizobium sediminis TaxID=2840469 RepID=A0A975NSU2_9BRAD|nr:site-specific DNA-methyltransferase [Bradyrhizobium sediminis]
MAVDGNDSHLTGTVECKATDDDLQRLQIEYWPIDRLIPYARNARTHSETQVAEIAGSIRSFGFSNPIQVSSAGDIVAGHGRLAAARKLGLSEVPVVVLPLSDLNRRQLVLADNRIAMNAGWDNQMLSLELADLSAMGANLSALGFTTKELAFAFSSVQGGLTDEDQIPEVAEVAISRPGDIWQLGPHRIACGDSRDEKLVEALFAGTVPQLMVTDPPYGVQYDPEWRHRRGVSNSARKNKIKNDEIADWTPTWDIFQGEIAYVWHGALRSTIVAESLAKSGFTIRAQIIWAKERLVMSQGDYHWQHEPCWYAVRKKGNWTGDRKQTTLWTIGSGGQDAKTEHATQKPVECMRRPMLNNSIPGQAIYEPFLGSGTTLIAAQSCGRACLGIEIDPLFVDLAIRRWQAFTGEEAVRASDGLSFDALCPEAQSSEEAS